MKPAPKITPKPAVVIKKPPSTTNIVKPKTPNVGKKDKTSEANLQVKPVQKKPEVKVQEKKETKIELQQPQQVISQNVEKQTPLKMEDINFMDKKKQQNLNNNKQIPVGTVYQGYKTIPIQKLELKQPYQKKQLDGNILWKTCRNSVHCYRQSCPLSIKTWNGFFQTLYQAYTNHADLKITPDDVWLTIMLYFSKYVNKHAKQLRKAFVSHQGQKQLEVKGYSVDETDWSEFFPNVIEAIRKNTVEDVTSKLECDFSSTDEFSTVMSTAIIMNTFKEFFKFKYIGEACGIVNIHMGGTLEDWQKLEKKLEYLREFDVDGKLKKYVDRLKPVLEQFTQTYKGNAHLQFWNNIYQERVNPDQTQYDLSEHINGWLIRFFTTLNELDNTDQAKIEKISVPIRYVNLTSKVQKDVILVGGCQGISIEDEKVYRPHFSFAITEEKFKKAVKHVQKQKPEIKTFTGGKKVEEVPKKKPAVPKTVQTKPIAPKKP